MAESKHPLDPQELAQLADSLGLRIMNPNTFDPLQAMRHMTSAVSIEHKATRTLVAGDLQDRMEIFRFLKGWQTALDFLAMAKKVPE